MLHSWHLESCVAHSRCSISVYWLKEWALGSDCKLPDPLSIRILHSFQHQEKISLSTEKTTGHTGRRWRSLWPPLITSLLETHISVQPRTPLVISHLGKARPRAEACVQVARGRAIQPNQVIMHIQGGVWWARCLPGTNQRMNVLVKKASWWLTGLKFIN